MLNFLADENIHVWWTKLDHYESITDQFYRLLSPEEQNKADRFINSKARRQYIKSHGLLRTLLADYLSLKPIAINFVFNQHGKPALASYPQFNFNLSHSADLAIFAFAKYEVGIDIEFIQSTFNCLEIAQRFFAEEEYRVLAQASSALQHTIFFKMWTLKEALIKALGLGLTKPLNEFKINPQVIRQNIQIEADNYTLVSLALINDYSSALAIKNLQSKDPKITIRKITPKTILKKLNLY